LQRRQDRRLRHADDGKAEQLPCGMEARIAEGRDDRRSGRRRFCQHLQPEPARNPRLGPPRK